MPIGSKNVIHGYPLPTSTIIVLYNKKLVRFVENKPCHATLAVISTLIFQPLADSLFVPAFFIQLTDLQFSNVFLSLYKAKH